MVYAGRWMVMALLLGLASMVGGCDSPPRSNAPVLPGEWPFWPASMRVHPLTRLVAGPNADTIVLEARVEFLDGDGHGTKASGAIRLDLDLGPGSSVALETPSWELNLADREVNRRQFDDVTRTYLFRLEILAKELPRGTEIKAYFLSSNGQKLDATYVLK